MTIIVNGTVTSATNTANGSSLTLATTLPSLTDCLVVTEAGDAPTTAAAPTSMTIGIPGTFSVNLTQVPSSSATTTLQGNQQESSIWYITLASWNSQVAALGRTDAFTGVSYTITATYGAVSMINMAICQVPLAGVNQTNPVGLAVTQTQQAVTLTPSITATGSNPADLYIAVDWMANTVNPSSGANQTSRNNRISRSSFVISTDTAVAAQGAFGWTFTGATGSWCASAVNFIGWQGYDQLLNATTTDLVVYNQNWTYAIGATNHIQVTTTGAQGNTGTGLRNLATAFWNSVSFTADQQSQCTLGSLAASGGSAGVGVRMGFGSGGFGYIAIFQSGIYDLEVITNGTAASLISGAQNHTSNAGDVILLQVRGSTLTLTVNGVTLKTVTDTTLSSGEPGIAFNTLTALTQIKDWSGNSLGTNLSGQTSTATIGQIGPVVGAPLGHQSVTATIGTSGSRNIDVTLGGQTATFLEGNLLFVIALTGQTATFTEGIITTTASGDKTIPLVGLSATFSVGQLFDDVSYLLDQNTVTLVGQTSTFALGSMTALVSPTITALTSTTSVGTPTFSMTYPLTAQTVISTEGFLTSSAGNNQNFVLGSQAVNTSLGVISPEADYFPPAMTVTFTEGQIFFSASGDITLSLTGQTATFTEGVMVFSQTGDEWTAREELMNAGLVPVVQYAEDPAVPPGFVISQSPPAGSVVPINSPVVMVVSRGPYSPQGTTVVPDFTGLFAKDATDGLAENLLSQDKYVWQANAALPGTVVAQSVTAGSTVPTGTLVQLTLSAGPVRVAPTVPVPTIH